MIKLNQEKLSKFLQQTQNTKAREFLDKTDWYVLRKQETGEDIPVDILEARQKARDSIIEVDSD